MAFLKRLSCEPNELLQILVIVVVLSLLGEVAARWIDKRALRKYKSLLVQLLMGRVRALSTSLSSLLKFVQVMRQSLVVLEAKLRPSAEAGTTRQR